MQYAFMDNFRGFVNTTVPLADVNFLVGENSSGKTSLLTMLRMLSGTRSFNLAEPDRDGLQLGHFAELVSVHSDDQSYFRLGTIREQESENREKHSIVGMLFTYNDVGGLPQVSRVTLALIDREYSLDISGEQILFKTERLKEPIKDADEMSERIPIWVNNHASIGSGWTEIKHRVDHKSAQVPLFYYFFMALSRRDNDDDSLRSIIDFAPTEGPNIIWIAPIRTKPLRTYDEPHTPFSTEGSHIPYVIKRMLGSESDARKFKDFMSRVGVASGLFEDIEIKHFGPESGTSPFEVDAKVDGKALSLSWLGYGVSQSLPIFVELLVRPEGSWFAIQQPEVHLHPRAQACLGDVFFEMAIRDKKRFLIETHSDFTIDRFRMNYRRKYTKKEKKAIPSSQILFFERRDGHNTVTPISISDTGETSKTQPDGYRDFFIKEEMSILEL